MACGMHFLKTGIRLSEVRRESEHVAGSCGCVGKWQSVAECTGALRVVMAHASYVGLGLGLRHDGDDARVLGDRHCCGGFLHSLACGANQAIPWGFGR